MAKSQIKKIILILLVVIVTTSAYFFGVLILPQLGNLKQDSMMEPVLASDEEVLAVIRENSDKTSPELSQYAEDLYYENKTKEAYQLYLLASQNDPGDVFYYVGMANCYRDIGNVPIALQYVEKVLPDIKKYESIVDLHFMKRSIANIYTQAASWLSYIEPQVAIDMVNEVLILTDKMDKEDETSDGYYKATRIEMYLRLSALYSDSPVVFDQEKAYEALKGLINSDSNSKYNYYSIALNRFDAGDIAMGKIYMDRFNKEAGLTTNRFVLSAYYHLLTGEYSKAKFDVWLMGLVSIDEDTKLNHYFISAVVAEGTGDLQNAKKYYNKMAEIYPYETTTKRMIDAKERLGLDYSMYDDELTNYKESLTKRSLELNGEPPIVH